MLRLYAIIGLFLSGCTSLPDLKKDEARQDLTHYKGQDHDAEFPKDEWWKKYKEPPLNKLIEIGIAHSPTIKQAFAQIEKANAFAVRSGAELMPSFSLDASVKKYKQSYNQGVPSAFVPQGFKDFGSAGLSFSYEFDFYNKYENTYNAAIMELNASNLTAKQAEILLSVEITDQYATLSTLYAKQDVAKEALDVRLQTKELFAKRFKEGVENESSFEQANTAYQVAQSELESIAEQISRTVLKISELVGQTPDFAKTIRRPSFSCSSYLKMPKEIPSNLLSRRIDVMISKTLTEASALRIDIAKAGEYPTVSLLGNLGQQSLGLNYFFDRDSFTSSFGPSIHLPIFNKRQIEGNYRQAVAEYNDAVARYEGSILKALHEVSSVLTSYKALLNQLEYMKQAKEASQKAYDIAKERYQGGLATYLEVLRAEDNFLDVKKTLIDLQSNILHLDIQLVRSLGGGYNPNKEA
ncbi:MAG: Outer membrane protein OprM [Holosporales bacterium]